MAKITFDGAVFRAEGWRGPPPSGGWPAAFAVFASDAADAPALLGAYSLDGEAIVFTPRFKPAPSLTLRAVFSPAEGASVRAIFGGSAAEPAGAPPRVAAIYPSARVWPANVLKFYIQFSAPMRIGDAWKRVCFRDDAGAVVEGAFVEIDQELWDPEGKRLTILFDPGRLKRGLIDHEDSGAPLAEGQSYTLEIDGGWKDSRGQSLGETITRRILIGPDMRLPVDPGFWRVTPPSAPDHALIVDFPRPLDHALALRTISVRRDGAFVPGQATLEADETRWRFAPASPWTPGAYALVAERTIEDLAGNKLGRLFDVDTHDPAQQGAAPHALSIAFEVDG